MGGPSHKGNDPDQLKSELHPTGKAHLFADQVASIYFGTKSYVPDQDDHKTLKALAEEYLYTARRRGELRGKVIGHADVEMSADPDNQELSFQRARWTAAVFKFYVADAAALSPTNLQFETEGAGTGFCMGDPACKGKVGPDALAQYRRADIMIFTEKMPSPQVSSCPPTSGASVKTLGEYIELVRCAEVRTGLDPRKMLALLRQMYYGKPWSATSKDPSWDSVIPCSPDIGDPKDKLGQPLFDALHNTVTIEGTDLGHVFAGLEAMTCPASSVTLKKSKFGMGIKLTVDLSNESFATWGGDLGQVAGVFVACWMMTNQERATKGKDKCHQGSMPESIEQYFVKPWAAPPADLEGDIAPFVIRAAERGACGGPLEQRFTPQAPISQIFTNFFYNRGPGGTTSKDRYQCFAEAIGANVINGKITNRAALIGKYQPGVLSFAWAYYIQFKKEIPRSDPVVHLLDGKSTAVLHLFFDWLQARMRP
jgi:outer membrane protein OmpA-like peptidoglycan-associated protein